MHLTEELYSKIFDNLLYEKAKSSAQKYIAYKIRSKKEVIIKLESLEYPFEVIEKVIDLFERYGYINDLQYAVSFIKDSNNLKCNGRKKIEYELINKGIDKSIIQNAFDKSNIDSGEPIEKLINKKLRNKNYLDKASKQKIIKYLMGKGFDYIEIIKVIEEKFDNFIMYEDNDEYNL